MATKPQSGMGTLFSHTSAWFTYVDGIDWSGIERSAIEITHLGTAVYSGTAVIRRMTPGDLVNLGQIACRLFWNQDATPPIFGDEEVVTLTGPKPKGRAKGCIITGEAFITAMSVAIVLDDKCTGDATLTFTGESYAFTASV